MREIRALVLALLAVYPVCASREPVRTRHAMVVTREPIATGVGVAVLKSGGNAVDAAVAVGFALAVTHPSAGNLGGGGFMLVRMADGRSVFLDFRERAPLAATRDMYLDEKGQARDWSLVGYLAAGVPGTVKGLEAAHARFGRMPWAGLVSPAVRLAREGFPVSYDLARSLRSHCDLFEPFPDSRRIFLNRGMYYDPGDRLIQTDLAGTLDRIEKYGAKGFYEGKTARLLAEDMKANGGLITEEDLRQYTVVERTPLKGSYRGHDILTAPPPSSGGIGLLQMMGMLETTGYHQTGAGSAATIHWVAEAQRRFYADRSQYLADPDFVQVPVSKLLSKSYIDERRKTIDPARASTSTEIHPGKPESFSESAETTHYSVVDEEGNAVAVTYTLNGGFGNGVTAKGLGFLLNNEMDDFSAKPGQPNLYGAIQGEANAIQPRKHPLSSMTPTIVTREGELRMVVGSPGGTTIINTVLEVILNVIDFRMNIQKAVEFPRFHHQWMPDELRVESDFSPDTIDLLTARGHKIRKVAQQGEVCAILWDGSWLQGAADGRTEATAAGY
ncbi:MAG: gamma-glutamyltransferase [Bryobacteraceae bacterium]